LKSKNITFISLNYFPEDTAIGLYSSQWVDHLQSQGFNVSVITAFPYYPQWEIRNEYKNKPRFIKENKESVKIYRYKQYVPKTPTFFKRIIHLVDFTIGSFFNLFKIKECDLIISIVPFTGSILLGYILKKRFKAKLWVHVQDFEFDAALQTGVSNKTNIFFSLLFKVEKYFFSKSDIASTISRSMLSKLETKTKSEKYFLPNWIDENKINPDTSAQHDYLKSPKKKILYSGNIGDKQDWNSFLQFCKDLDDSIYKVIIVGDGAKRAWLEESIKPLNIATYYPPVEYEVLSSLLCSADLHVLFQKIDVIDTVMPSKVLGMMASGKPSLVIGNEKSEVKAIFDISGGGLYYNNYSDEIITDLDDLYKDKLRPQKMGNNARKFVVDNFSKSAILDKTTLKIGSL